MKEVAIVVLVVSLLLSLPYILPADKEAPELENNELREMALSLNLKPTPTDFKTLLKIIDNPENPISKEKIALGKFLFFDPLLSKDKDISCASCHKLKEGGDDNLATAIGHKGQANPSHLNSPTVLNAALATAQFWDARAKDVEAQAHGPIQAPFEMNMTPDELVERLNTVPSYKEKFKLAFPEDNNDAINFDNITKAIGAYERTLLTRGSFDEFLEGDNNAISDKAKHGLALFINKGCKGCHTGMSVGGLSVQKFPLRRNIADLFNLTLSPELQTIDTTFPFKNTGGFLGKNGNQTFRVPILRNITETGPYFHNGAVKDLEEAVWIMGKYQLGIDFSESQIDEVVAFLKTLQGEIIEYNFGD